MLNLETIENRIKDCQLELGILRTTHDQMTVDYNKATQVYNERTAINQARFQQLNGAIAELQKLKEETVSENGAGRMHRRGKENPLTNQG
jgi:response regulator RpfG family c-di-GMP phosphodiesterase